MADPGGEGGEDLPSIPKDPKALLQYIDGVYQTLVKGKYREDEVRDELNDRLWTLLRVYQTQDQEDNAAARKRTEEMVTLIHAVLGMQKANSKDPADFQDLKDGLKALLDQGKFMTESDRKEKEQEKEKDKEQEKVKEEEKEKGKGIEPKKDPAPGSSEDDRTRKPDTPSPARQWLAAHPNRALEAKADSTAPPRRGNIFQGDEARRALDRARQAGFETKDDDLAQGPAKKNSRLLAGAGHARPSGRAGGEFPPGTAAALALGVGSLGVGHLSSAVLSAGLAAGGFIPGREELLKSDGRAPTASEIAELAEKLKTDDRDYQRLLDLFAKRAGSAYEDAFRDIGVTPTEELQWLKTCERVAIEQCNVIAKLTGLLYKKGQLLQMREVRALLARIDEAVVKAKPAEEIVAKVAALFSPDKLAALPEERRRGIQSFLASFAEKLKNAGGDPVQTAALMNQFFDQAGAHAQGDPEVSAYLRLARSRTTDAMAAAQDERAARAKAKAQAGAAPGKTPASDPDEEPGLDAALAAAFALNALPFQDLLKAVGVADWAENQVQAFLEADYRYRERIAAMEQAQRSVRLLSAMRDSLPSGFPDPASRLLDLYLTQFDRIGKASPAEKAAKLQDWQNNVDGYLEGNKIGPLGEEARLKAELASSLGQGVTEEKVAQAEARLEELYRRHPAIQEQRQGRLALIALRKEALEQGVVPEGTVFLPSELGYDIPSAKLRVGKLKDVPGLFVEPGPGSKTPRSFQSSDGLLVVEYGRDAQGNDVEGHRIRRPSDGKVERELFFSGKRRRETEYLYDDEQRLVGKVIHETDDGKAVSLQTVALDPATGMPRLVRDLDPADGRTLLMEMRLGPDGKVEIRRPKAHVLQTGRVGPDGVEITESVIEGSGHKAILDERGELKAVVIDYDPERGPRDLERLAAAGLITVREGNNELAKLYYGLPSVGGRPQFKTPPTILMSKHGPMLHYEQLEGDGSLRTVSHGYDPKVMCWVRTEEVTAPGKRPKEKITVLKSWQEQERRFNNLETYETAPYVAYSVARDVHLKDGVNFFDYLWDPGKKEYRLYREKRVSDFGVLDILSEHLRYSFSEMHGFKELGQALGTLGDAGKLFGYMVTSAAADDRSEDDIRYKVVSYYQGLLATPDFQWLSPEQQQERTRKLGLACLDELRRKLGDERYGELRQAWVEEYRQKQVAKGSELTRARDLVDLKHGGFSLSDDELAVFLLTQAGEGFGGSGREFASRAADSGGLVRIGWGAAAVGVYGAEFTFQSLAFSGLGSGAQALNASAKEMQLAQALGKTVRWGKTAVWTNRAVQTAQFVQQAYFTMGSARDLTEALSAWDRGDSAAMADLLAQAVGGNLVPHGRDRTKQPGPNKTLGGLTKEALTTNALAKALKWSFGFGDPETRRSGEKPKTLMERLGYDPESKSFKLSDPYASALANLRKDVEKAKKAEPPSPKDADRIKSKAPGGDADSELPSARDLADAERSLLRQKTREVAETLAKAEAKPEFKMTVDENGNTVYREKNTGVVFSLDEFLALNENRNLLNPHYDANQVTPKTSRGAPSADTLGVCAQLDSAILQGILEYTRQRVRKGALTPGDKARDDRAKAAYERALAVGQGLVKGEMTDADVGQGVKDGTLAPGLDGAEVQKHGDCATHAVVNALKQSNPELAGMTAKDFNDLVKTVMGEDVAAGIKEGMGPTQALAIYQAIGRRLGVNAKVITPDKLLSTIAKDGRGAVVFIDAGGGGHAVFLEGHFIKNGKAYASIIDSNAGGRIFIPVEDLGGILRGGGIAWDAAETPNQRVRREGRTVKGLEDEGDIPWDRLDDKISALRQEWDRRRSGEHLDNQARLSLERQIRRLRSDPDLRRAWENRGDETLEQTVERLTEAERIKGILADPEKLRGEYEEGKAKGADDFFGYQDEAECRRLLQERLSGLLAPGTERAGIDPMTLLRELSARPAGEGSDIRARRDAAAALTLDGALPEMDRGIYRNLSISVRGQAPAAGKKELPRLMTMMRLMEVYLKERGLWDPAKMAKLEWQVDDNMSGGVEARYAAGTISVSGKLWRSLPSVDLASALVHEVIHALVGSSELPPHVVQSDFHLTMQRKLAEHGLNPDLSSRGGAAQRVLGRLKAIFSPERKEQRSYEADMDAVAASFKKGELQDYIRRTYGDRRDPVGLDSSEKVLKLLQRYQAAQAKARARLEQGLDPSDPGAREAAADMERSRKAVAELSMLHSIMKLYEDSRTDR